MAVIRSEKGRMNHVATSIGLTVSAGTGTDKENPYE